MYRVQIEKIPINLLPIPYAAMPRWRSSLCIVLDDESFRWWY
jgi:hypothetical protein